MIGLNGPLFRHYFTRGDFVVGTGPANLFGSTEVPDPTARPYGRTARMDFWKPICNLKQKCKFL